jgi:glycosyltransferase involved in cell wall biosynthesis
MRIAVLGTRGIPANYGGFETSAEQLSQRWAAAGHEVLVYARRQRYAQHPGLVNGVQVRYTGCFRRFGLETPSATVLSVLDLIVRKRQFGCVHLYDAGNAFVLPLLRVLGFRVLIAVDGIEWQRKGLKPLKRWAYYLGALLAKRFANRVVADNQVVVELYDRLFRCKASLIAYGAQKLRRSEDADEILSRFGLTANRYCIFVGRIVPEKNVLGLIDAFNRLETDLTLLIVGDGLASSYRNEVWKRQSNRVRLVGYQYGHICEQLLANARMYVSASTLEGTSPSLLSAMSAGLCCLVNGIPENRNTAQGSVALYDRDNENALVQTWQALLDDPERAARIGADGQAHQRRLYDWDVIAQQYIELFREVDEPRLR